MIACLSSPHLTYKLAISDGVIDSTVQIHIHVFFFNFEITQLCNTVFIY